jgi:hypothetical protein
MFAEFLRDRVAKLTPEENRIIELINEISAKRDAAREDRSVPEFVESEYAEAQSYAEKALKSVRAGDISKTKTLFFAANAYFDHAQRGHTELRDLNTKIAEMLGPAAKRPAKRR